MPRNYDLCLNSERLGFEGTMEAIEEYIKVRFGALPGTKEKSVVKEADSRCDLKGRSGNFVVFIQKTDA